MGETFELSEVLFDVMPRHVYRVALIFYPVEIITNEFA